MICFYQCPKIIRQSYNVLMFSFWYLCKFNKLMRDVYLNSKKSKTGTKHPENSIFCCLFKSVMLTKDMVCMPYMHVPCLTIWRTHLYITEKPSFFFSQTLERINIEFSIFFSTCGLFTCEKHAKNHGRSYCWSCTK